MNLLAVIVAAPAVAALLLLGVPARMRLTTRLVALAGAAVSLAGALLVAWRYDAGAGGLQMVADLPLVPSIGVHLRLGVDGWGVSLLLLTGVIIFAAVLASFTVERRTREFFVFLLLLVSGVFGVFVSQDLLVFFLFYEIAVLPMYLLIGIWGSSHAVAQAGPFRWVWKVFSIGGREYAAMKLTVMLLLGSAAILVGIFALYREAGAHSFDLAALGAVEYGRTTQLVVFPMLWIGFGTLAGVFPFHTWSPDGHASAPTAVSMLHAGVLMKLGAFGVMRVGMVLLPAGAVAWAPVVGAVAVVNIVYGAFCAMSQRDLKYIVAYSSVSHMGIVMLGAATLTPAGWNGAVFQMFAHGVMTGLLFALVGLVYERAHTREIARMGGFAAKMPAVAAFFTLACLSSLGLPGTAGFVAELLVFLGAWQGAHPWWTVPAIAGAFVTAVYVLRASRTIFWGPTGAPPDAPESGSRQDVRGGGPTGAHDAGAHDAGAHDAGAHGAGAQAELADPRRAEWAAPLLLGSAIVLFGVWPRLLLDVIDGSSGSYLHAIGQLVGRLP